MLPKHVLEMIKYMQLKAHKQWLDNEYSEWVKALQESTVHNFKEHPGVKRMLGDFDGDEFWELIEREKIDWDLMGAIEDIGNPTSYRPGASYRMIYYAQQILSRNPSSICEIGGGVGQFYAILRAIGYKGDYVIHDLPEVRNFQFKYLDEVALQTGLDINQYSAINKQPDFVCSFYALGEFDDNIKRQYKGMLNAIKRGYIAWNPHSGASDDLSLFKHDIKVSPGIEPGIKIVEW